MEQRWIEVDKKLMKEVKTAIDSALAYESATHGKRKLGITGEVGEVLVCYQFDLRLMLDSRSEGFDALDKGGKRVQIKTRRSESEELPKDIGRVSRFSAHPFDYALLVLLDHKYQLREVWQAGYNSLRPIIDKQKRRNPNLSLFKKVGKKVYPLI